jgi:hemoglobin/transferrin/lactoferrin receptor protein
MNIQNLFGPFLSAVGFLLIPFFFSTSSVMAQETPPDQARLEISAITIIVTPTRTERELREAPSSASIISFEDLSTLSATGIADALQDMPGVEVFDLSVAGAKRVQIRGESGSRVLVMIDGQRISEQKSMDGAALLIDPNRIERIEVIKGPGSVLYGSEAIGGVVNIITKKGGDRPVQGEISATYDSSAAGLNGYASVFGGFEGFSYRLSGNWTDYGDRRTPRGLLGSSSYELQDHAAFLGYRKGKVALGATYDNYRSDLNSHTPEGTVGGTLTYFQLDLPRWDRQKWGGHLEFNDLTSFLPRMRLDVYSQNTRKLFKNDMDLSIPMGRFGSMVIENRITTDNDQDTTGLNFQMDLRPHSDHYFIIGYEPVYDELDAGTETVSATHSPMPPPSGSHSTSTTNYIYDAAMSAHSLYIQDEWAFNSAWKATLGLRQTWRQSELKNTNDPSVDLTDSRDSHPVFSAGLTYSHGEHIVLRGLFSQGYRFPNLQQLFIGTMHGGSEPTFPNPDLDPESSNNYEFGIRFDNGALELDVAGFASLSENYITTVAVTGGRRFANIEETKSYGTEITAGYSIGSSGWQPYGSGTWLRRKYVGDAYSTYNTGEPGFIGRIGIRYERPLWKNRLQLYGDLFGRGATRAEEDYSSGERETYPSWATLNLTLGCRFGQQKQYFATMNLGNLFDRSYFTAQSTLLQPGTHAVIKIGASF